MGTRHHVPTTTTHQQRETRTEFDKRPTRSSLSRRELVTLGAAAGTATLFGPTNARLGAADQNAGLPPTPSPHTTPWRHALPVPPVKQALPSAGSLLGGPPFPAEHQYYGQFPPQKFYEVGVRAAQHTFHEELGPSLIWGYDGIFPGPTFDARYGQPLLVRIHNQLPTDADLAASPTFGSNEVITHLHNHHSASETDGGPWDFYKPGEFCDHHYMMAKAGFATPQFAGTGDPNEALGTLFYHAHRPDFTSPNVYKGQVGFFRAFDSVDTGDETSGLRLPSGEFDVPLLFADKAFDANGELFFDPFNLDGILGDKDTVNGIVQPFFRVQRRKYRFRMLIGGPARFWRFFLRSNGSFLNAPFIQIANDGNLLAAPIRRNALLMAPAERFDVVIDFKELTGSAGGELILYNRAEQNDGREPTGDLLSPGHPVLKFIVESGDPPDPSRVPATLRPQVPVDLSEVVQTRIFRFHRSNGAWQINNQFFDPRRSRAQVERNTAEIWVLRNADDGWQHPIHIHLEEFHILSRNGEAPPLWERGRKDVLILRGPEEVRIFMRFRDFPEPGFVHPVAARQPDIGRYPMHCHNLTHEDHAMMLRWDVLPGQE
jgi:FtsP/CotA-like multicopper oxidase with cupredoxin domain